MLKAAWLQLEIRLPGCRSLKEKRQRTRGLLERLGQRKNCAVCESGRQNSHQYAIWSIVIIGVSAPELERTLEKIEQSIESKIDGQVIDSTLTWL